MANSNKIVVYNSVILRCTCTHARCDVCGYRAGLVAAPTLPHYFDDIVQGKRIDTIADEPLSSLQHFFSTCHQDSPLVP